jgi:Ni/Co efflux regulator RcnB
MKKLITSALMIGAAIVAIPSMSVLAATPAPQDMQRQDRQDNNRRDNDRRDNDRNRNNRRERTTTTTRIVREGRFRYRETIETTYRNGRTRTRVIRRERIR